MRGRRAEGRARIQALIGTLRRQGLSLSLEAVYWYMSPISPRAQLKGERMRAGRNVSGRGREATVRGREKFGTGSISLQCPRRHAETPVKAVANAGGRKWRKRSRAPSML